MERCEFATLIAVDCFSTSFKSLGSEARLLPLKPEQLAPNLGEFPVAMMRYPLPLQE